LAKGYPIGCTWQPASARQVRSVVEKSPCRTLLRPFIVLRRSPVLDQEIGRVESRMTRFGWDNVKPGFTTRLI
jgi:hypothetical protein